MLCLKMLVDACVWRRVRVKGIEEPTSMQQCSHTTQVIRGCVQAHLVMRGRRLLCTALWVQLEAKNTVVQTPAISVKAPLVSCYGFLVLQLCIEQVDALQCPSPHTPISSCTCVRLLASFAHGKMLLWLITVSHLLCLLFRKQKVSSKIICQSRGLWRMRGTS